MGTSSLYKGPKSSVLLPSDFDAEAEEEGKLEGDSAWKMTEKWELGGIDCDEIEANSSLTLDGGFDFNSI